MRKTIKIMIYVSYLLKNQKHNKIIYEFMDEKNKVYTSEYREKFNKLIYMVDPENGPYDITFRGANITITFEMLNEDGQLYDFLGPRIYEKPFRMIINGQCHDKMIETFIQEGIKYANRYIKGDHDDNKQYIYEYCENEEVWDNYSDVHSRDIETIYLPMKGDVVSDVEKFLSSDTEKIYKKFGIPYHKTYCFHGPPGSGKTSLIHSICTKIKKNICIYRFSNSTTDYRIANALKWMPDDSVFVLEDIDRITANHNNITISGILNIMDGISSKEGLIIFITTNHFLELDKAIKRPGRIDYILEFNYISKEQLQQMLSVYYPEEIKDCDEIYKEIKKYKMTVSYIQKYLFSLYPNGGVLKNLSEYLQEIMKYYSPDDKNIYI